MLHDMACTICQALPPALRSDASPSPRPRPSDPCPPSIRGLHSSTFQLGVNTFVLDTLGVSSVSDTKAAQVEHKSAGPCREAPPPLVVEPVPPILHFLPLIHVPFIRGLHSSTYRLNLSPRRLIGSTSAVFDTETLQSPTCPSNSAHVKPKRGRVLAPTSRKHLERNTLGICGVSVTKNVFG